MSRDNTSVLLVSAECVHAIADEKDAAQMLSKAFKAARNHWMVLDDDPQLRGALNAVLVKMGEEHPDRKRLETEIDLLAKFNAFLQAAQNGLSVDVPTPPEGYEPIGVMKLWHESA